MGASSRFTGIYASILSFKFFTLNSKNNENENETCTRAPLLEYFGGAPKADAQDKMQMIQNTSSSFEHMKLELIFCGAPGRVGSIVAEMRDSRQVVPHIAGLGLVVAQSQRVTKLKSDANAFLQV